MPTLALHHREDPAEHTNEPTSALGATDPAASWHRDAEQLREGLRTIIRRLAIHRPTAEHQKRFEELAKRRVAAATPLPFDMETLHADALAVDELQRRRQVQLELLQKAEDAEDAAAQVRREVGHLASERTRAWRTPVSYLWALLAALGTMGILAPSIDSFVLGPYYADTLGPLRSLIISHLAAFVFALVVACLATRVGLSGTARWPTKLAVLGLEALFGAGLLGIRITPETPLSAGQIGWVCLESALLFFHALAMSAVATQINKEARVGRAEEFAAGLRTQGKRGHRGPSGAARPGPRPRAVRSQP